MLLDFRQVFKALRAKTHHLDFYPGGLRGFIESCVLASQRDMGIELRDLTTLMDLRQALNARVTEDVAEDRTTINANALMEQALPLAEIINDYVHRQMELITEDLGPYSIDPLEFQWTEAHGLAVRFTF